MEFSIFSIITLLGGLAMFLYGIEIMGDGLKSSSASALKKILGTVTASPVTGFLLGVAITAIIQSSMATIVLSVGLIGAGILTLKQSISIMIGANVGTTITGQIIRLLDVETSGSGIMKFFEPSTLAPLALIIGIILIMFVKRGSAKSLGLIAMGFGILFIGLLEMTESMAPLSESERFKSIIAQFSNTPVWGVIIGTLITLIVQSSSVSVGILQTLCATGVMRFSGAYSYVIGAAFGTCIITAAVCSIGTKEDAKRLCCIHVLFSIIGGIFFMSIVEIFHAFGIMDDVYSGTITSGGVADFQTMFKLVTALILLPFIPFLEKMSRKIIKDRPKPAEDTQIEESLSALDPHLLRNPSVAIAQAERVITKMAEVAMRNYDAEIEQIYNYDPKADERINELEDLLDKMADSTNSYLIALAPYIEKESENKHLNFLLKAFTAFERVGDLAINIMDDMDHMRQDGSKFSDSALDELRIATDAVREVLEKSALAFYEDSIERAKEVEPLEEVVDDLIEQIKERHIERQKAGNCTIMGGIQYQNILQNLERISDQCSDLAVYLIAKTDPAVKGNEHQYLQTLHETDDAQYRRIFESGREKYITKLENMKLN